MTQEEKKKDEEKEEEGRIGLGGFMVTKMPGSGRVWGGGIDHWSMQCARGPNPDP